MHPTSATPGPRSRAQQAAQAIVSALDNPHQYPPHYAQAYSQSSARFGAPLTTPEGYSYSSTYVPSLQSHSRHNSTMDCPSNGARELHFSRSRGGRFRDQLGRQQPSPWYEPGNCRCTYEQCTFTGSKKSIEIHMMDRHLIYPLDWNKRKSKGGWDADPSLRNGKPIPIQGTNVVLDTPEAVEVWIAERKKRWPTATRVEGKEKKLKDALLRGEITASDPDLRGCKRPRKEYERSHVAETGRWRGRGQRNTQAPRTRLVHPLPMKPVTTTSLHVSDDGSSGSGSDVDPEKDAISSKPAAGFVRVPLEEAIVKDGKEPLAKDVLLQSLKPVSRKPAIRPKVPLSQKNPFTSRPSLLHNLLRPEIRVTVSNLSQAIHFLVENDFLRDVELNPGDADNRPIEVIAETNHDSTSVVSSVQDNNPAN